MKLKNLIVLFLVLVCFHLVVSGQNFNQFHFSIEPTVSKHGNVSKNCSYYCSLNLLGGHVKTINGFEFGSIFNKTLEI